MSSSVLRLALLVSVSSASVLAAGCDSTPKDANEPSAKAASSPGESNAPTKAAADDAEPEPKPEEADDAAPQPPSAPEVGDPIEFERLHNEALGYAIELPKGSEILQQDDSGHTYSLVFDGEVHELNTHIAAWAHPDLASLRRDVEAVGSAEVDTEEELEGGLLRIITKPREPFGIDVWVAVTGKELRVRCSGPTSHRDDLVKTCSSIRPLE